MTATRHAVGVADVLWSGEQLIAALDLLRHGTFQLPIECLVSRTSYESP